MCKRQVERFYIFDFATRMTASGNVISCTAETGLRLGESRWLTERSLAGHVTEAR